MDINSVISICKDYIQSNESAILLGKDREKIKESISIITQHISILSNDKTIDINKVDTDLILNSLKIINNIILDIPVNNKVKEFILAYSLLVYNWNKNVSNDSNIELFCKNLDRLVNFHLSSIELIEAMKRASKMINDNRCYAMPSIELSKHYLETLINNEKESV